MRKGWIVLLLCLAFLSIGFADEAEAALDPRLEVLYHFDESMYLSGGFIQVDGTVILASSSSATGEFATYITRISPKGEIVQIELPKAVLLGYDWQDGQRVQIEYLEAILISQIWQIPGKSGYILAGSEGGFLADEELMNFSQMERYHAPDSFNLDRRIEAGDSGFMNDQMSRNYYASFLTIPDKESFSSFDWSWLSVSDLNSVLSALGAPSDFSATIYGFGYGESDEEVIGILVENNDEDTQTPSIVRLEKSKVNVLGTPVIDLWGHSLEDSEGKAILHTEYAIDDSDWNLRKEWAYEKVSRLPIAYPIGIDRIERSTINEVQIKGDAYEVLFNTHKKDLEGNSIRKEPVSILCRYDFDGSYMDQIEIPGNYNMVVSKGNQVLLLPKSKGFPVLRVTRETKKSTGGMRSLIQERTRNDCTLARFGNQGFGLLKQVEEETKIVDFRAPLKTDKNHVVLQIPYADIQSKTMDEARNLLIEYGDDVIKIPFTFLHCDEALALLPCQTDATIEIRLERDCEGMSLVQIQLFVVEQVDAKTKLVHRRTIQ